MSYQYHTSDGRTIFSPISLDYAFNPDCSVNLCKVSTADQRHISIIADSALAKAMAAVIDATSKNCNADSKNSAMPHPHDYCVMLTDKVCIKDGKQYKPLIAFLKGATEEEKEFAVTQLATQAAMLHLELEIDREKVS